MKLTSKGRYAVMALVDLARFDNINPVSLRDISLRQGISLDYLEQIFSKLRNLKPSKGGEIHITDAIQLLINDNEKFIAHNFSGKYLDCGSMKGYINSSKEIAKL